MGSCASLDSKERKAKSPRSPKTEEEKQREEAEWREYQARPMSVSDKIEKKRPAPLALDGHTVARH